jgi:GH18 family chitinase
MSSHQVLIHATLAAATFPLCCTHNAQSEVAPTQSHQPLRVVGYLPYYEFKSFDLSNAKMVSDLIYFSAQPNDAGDLDHTDISNEALDRLLALKDRFGTHIQLAIGGWGRCKSFAAVATNPDKRKHFVQVLLQYCLDRKLDGVDFDWEFPAGPQENEAYSLLLIETKAAFRSHGMLVTVALSPSQELADDAYQAVDRVHIMSYDHSGDEHSTIKQAQSDVEAFLARQVPKDKLILGVPFYGRKRDGNPNAMSYSQIVSRFHPVNAEDSAGGYNFNGIDTIRKKTRYALDQRIGGVMIWELGQDTNDLNSLLRAVSNESEKR